MVTLRHGGYRWGESYFGAHWRIGLPVARPALATIVLLMLMGIRNAYLIPLVFLAQHRNYQTLTIALIRYSKRFQTLYHNVAAGAIIAPVPVTILFIALQRYFICGLTGGAAMGASHRRGEVWVRPGGAIDEGGTMPSMTIEDIATLAGVSRSTVSRVLNDHPRVSPDVRERVRRVIAEHGYTPHAAARSLAGSRTNVICLFSLRGAATIFSDQFIPPLVQGISEVCNDRGYFLLLSMVQVEQATSLYQRIVRGSHCDGIITLASDVDDALLELIVEDRTPFVLIGHHPRYPQVASVDAENVAGARQATAHLIGLGHRRIATITGPLDAATGADRRDGYLAALREAGLPPTPELMVEGTFHQESGQEAMRGLLALPERPTAVFAASDSMAAGALAAIREAGLRVPEDVAVVGFDDSPIASLTAPMLTTVRQPIYRLGAEAARLLIDQLQDSPPEPRRERLPVEMVIRDSCGARGR